jgi:hypothetical protein
MMTADEFVHAARLRDERDFKVVQEGNRCLISDGRKEYPLPRRGRLPAGVIDSLVEFSDLQAVRLDFHLDPRGDH